MDQHFDAAGDARLAPDQPRSERQPGDPEEVLEVWLERTFAPRPFPRPH
jgi:hypothetical protein